MPNLKQQNVSISPKMLFAIYFCIPAALLLVVLDTFMFQHFLQRSFSKDPASYALFTLLFTLPHILSSFFGFFDKKYVEYYRPRLFRGARYAVFGALLLPLINLQLAFFVFALFTMLHVIRQQSGIAKSIMKGANKYHPYWEWAGVVLSLALYVDIYTTVTATEVMTYIWLAGAVIYTYLGFKAVAGATTKIGKQYFWVTHIIPLAAALFLLLDYPLLAIAIPRIIHDLTGYLFYIAHDNNRFNDTRSNYLYGPLAKLGIPVYVLNPVLSIGIALLFQFNTFLGSYITLTVLFLFHYYLESFMWKRDSLHRQYIRYYG